LFLSEIHQKSIPISQAIQPEGCGKKGRGVTITPDVLTRNHLGSNRRNGNNLSQVSLTKQIEYHIKILFSKNLHCQLAKKLLWCF